MKIVSRAQLIFVTIHKYLWKHTAFHQGKKKKINKMQIYKFTPKSVSHTCKCILFKLITEQQRKLIFNENDID